MVKVKTVICVLCVCNPLFTSQHSLSWDTRLWALLGGTTRTRWFSNNDIPKPKGKQVTTTTYVDANLHHDQVTGRAVTACLHLVNATPSHWYHKRQAK